jgi:hypothetical protein
MLITIFDVLISLMIGFDVNMHRCSAPIKTFIALHFYRYEKCCHNLQQNLIKDNREYEMTQLGCGSMKKGS